MKDKSFLSRLRHLGYLMHSYSLMKALGIPVSLVLERIITERQHALSNDLHEKGWFCINCAEISFHIGLSIEDITVAIDKLATLNLIEARQYKGLDIVRVDEEELLNFVKVVENDKDYKMWDYYLFPVQRQILYIKGEENNG